MMHDLVWYKLQEAETALENALMQCAEERAEYKDIKELHERTKKYNK